MMDSEMVVINPLLDENKPFNQVELSKAIGGILDILMALDEETVVKWIKDKHPCGIGL
jgi:hypothetical protein